MRALGLWSSLALCAGMGCQESAPTCRFGREYAVFRSDTQSFHDLRSVRLAGHTLALFSDASGVHAQPLDARGAPQGALRRLFDACDGGLDADSGERELHVACVRRATGEAELERVTLYTLDAQLAVRATQAFGRAGRLSHGISLARRGTHLAVSWHDAAVSGARIWYFEPGRMAVPRLLSDETWDASAPTLVWDGPRMYASWAETRYAGERAHSRIVIASPRASGASPQVVLESRDPAPSPHLVVLPSGLMLSFRDKRERSRKTGLYLARLSRAGSLDGPVVRAGRADGVASPVLAPCLGGVVSATPRTFAGDYFVGVVRADAELRRLSAEQQFYEDSREFDRVAVHCAQDSALLLIAERGRLFHGNAALRTTTFHCD